MSHKITEITRRAIINEIIESEFHWSGSNLDEVEFLSRIYPLDELRSTDSRFDSADRDIWQHRYNNYDWEDDWVFEDERFCLMNGGDEEFLRFLSEAIHPVVRPKIEEVLDLVDIYNTHLKYDGYELRAVESISGRPIYSHRVIEPVDYMVYENISDEVDYSQIWDDGIFRVFISHTATWKADAEKLKKALQLYDIASFVAHTDVDPTVEWLQEIEKALKSMDLIVPMITDDFRKSVWTDQEVGAAVGRSVPVFPVKIEKDPHGFMAKIQAIAVRDGNMEIVADEIVKGLIKKHAVGHSSLSAIDAFLVAVGRASSFSQGNRLASLLPSISTLSPRQEEMLVQRYNENSQIHRAYEFRGIVVSELERIAGNLYSIEAGRLYRV